MLGIAGTEVGGCVISGTVYVRLHAGKRVASRREIPAFSEGLGETVNSQEPQFPLPQARVGSAPSYVAVGLLSAGLVQPGLQLNPHQKEEEEFHSAHS